jgi:hypothetical protein
MARLIAKHALWVAVLTALPFLCPAQEKPFVMPLVPAADWRQVNSQSLPLSTVGNYGGDLAVEQEYGVKSLELRTYQLHKTQTLVLVEPAADTVSAYGLLTFYETPAMVPEKGIQLAVGDDNQTLMARGNKFIRFLHAKSSVPSHSDFQALLSFVGGSKLSASALDSLPAPMPAKDLQPGSEKFILGLEAAKRALPSFRNDLVGFDYGAEVQLGQYKAGKSTSTLISINYPTPQIARIRFGALKSFLGLNQNNGESSSYGVRHGSYVFLVLNAENEGTATALMNQFQVTEGVSWDQPYVSEKTFTKQLVQMILAIFVLTAFLIAACVVAGVLFFLSRRFAAKFFPDSSWGHTDEDQLIRLNLRM